MTPATDLDDRRAAIRKLCSQSGDTCWEATAAAMIRQMEHQARSDEREERKRLAGTKVKSGRSRR